MVSCYGLHTKHRHILSCSDAEFVQYYNIVMPLILLGVLWILLLLYVSKCGLSEPIEPTFLCFTAKCFTLKSAKQGLHLSPINKRHPFGLSISILDLLLIASMNIYIQTRLTSYVNMHLTIKCIKLV